MLQDQILRAFRELNKGEVLLGYNTLIARLLKVQKVDTEIDAENLINETLTKLLNPDYRKKFRSVLLGINPNGIALSRSFTKELKRDMECRLSIYLFFSNMNLSKAYESSGMKAAVHGAKNLHASLPNNTGLTITL